MEKKAVDKNMQCTYRYDILAIMSEICGGMFKMFLLLMNFSNVPKDPRSSDPICFSL